jgi:hypothetical protein
MVKNYSNLYDHIHHPLNIWWAYKAAARGKRYTPTLKSPIPSLEYVRHEDNLGSTFHVHGNSRRVAFLTDGSLR